MIVADTNIISYLLIPSPYSESVDKLYSYDSQWTAPLLWRSEFRNVVTLYLRKGIVSLEKSLQLLDAAESMMTGMEYEIPSSQILALVAKSSCSSYDCEFIALAHHLDLPLVTQDKKLLREFPKTAISIANFLADH